MTLNFFSSIFFLILTLLLYWWLHVFLLNIVLSDLFGVQIFIFADMWDINSVALFLFLLIYYAIFIPTYIYQYVSLVGLDDNECRRFMNRLSKDNIAQIFIFKPIDRNQNHSTVGGRQTRQLSNICIVNTHLYSNHTR